MADMNRTHYTKAFICWCFTYCFCRAHVMTANPRGLSYLAAPTIETCMLCVSCYRVYSNVVHVPAVIAMLLPFFNDIVGLLGSTGFWPLTGLLPIQMHI